MCVCVFVLHLAMGVDASVDEPLQYELGELVFQSCYCGVEGLSHLSHVCRHVGAEILNTQHVFLLFLTKFLSSGKQFGSTEVRQKSEYNGNAVSNAAQRDGEKTTNSNVYS